MHLKFNVTGVRIHDLWIMTEHFMPLNPKVHSPPFAATAITAVPLQLYQEDPVCQQLGLRLS